MHGDVMWKSGTGCLSLIHQMQRVKVIIRAPEGWWCRAAPSAAAAHTLPKAPDLAGSEPPELRWCHLSVLLAQRGWVGVKRHPGVLDLGFKTWVSRGRGCRFTPTVNKLLSSVGQSPPPVSHRQIPDNISPPHMFFTHRVHYPRVICLHSSDITWSSSPEPLPMQNLFFSFFWRNCKIKKINK